MRRLLVPGSALAVALVVAAGAQAQGLNAGGRNPRHGSLKKGTTVVGKLKGSVLGVRNIGGGPAFTFVTNGLLGGKITVGKGGDSAVPFTTNATGVATGLNADRLDGHHASDFVLASSVPALLKGPIDATTLQGKQASDFLAANGKAANSNLLDGLDSTAFLGVNGTAADSSKLGGNSPSFYEPSANHLSLSAHPFMNSGDATATVGSGPGWTLKSDCSGTTQIDLTLQNTGANTAYLSWSGLSSNEQYSVAASGSQNVFSHGTGDILTSGSVAPLSVSIVRDDGTTYQGVITVGVGIGGHDCFVTGSLSS